MNTVKSLILMLAGLIAGIAGTNIFNSHNSALRKVSAGAVSSVRQDAAQADLQYAQKMDSMQQVNDLLSDQVKATKAAIKVEQYNYSVLKQVVDTLINHEISATDTAARLQDCDSLAAAVTDMMETSAYKDTLSDSIASCLSAQVTNAAQNLLAQQQQYSALKAAFDQSMVTQDALQSENFQLKRQHHKQVVRSKLISTGIVVAAGVLTYGILRH